MNNKFGFKEKRISMGIFDFDVICVIGDHKNLENYCRWKFDNKDFSLPNIYEARGWCIFSRGYVPVIWIPRLPKTPREYAILAHECLHAVYHLLEWASIPMTRDTEEVVTHSMSHLITKILSNDY